MAVSLSSSTAEVLGPGLAGFLVQLVTAPLAILLDATLRLVAPPKHRAMCVVQFHDLLESLAATPLILRHHPSAVELVDRFILDSTRGR